MCSYSVYPPGGNSVTLGEENEVYAVKVELNMLERVHRKILHTIQGLPIHYHSWASQQNYSGSTGKGLSAGPGSHT